MPAGGGPSTEAIPATVRGEELTGKRVKPGGQEKGDSNYNGARVSVREAGRKEGESLRRRRKSHWEGPLRCKLFASKTRLS